MPTTSKVSHAQAYSAFETALTWLEEQDNTDSAHLLLVQKWRICSGETYSNQKKNNVVSNFTIVCLLFTLLPITYQYQKVLMLHSEILA